MRKLAVWVAIFAGVGCSGTVPTGSDSQEVIGGNTDNGDPSVVALFVHQPGVSSGTLCTATAIAPATLLTAAHCVAPAATGAGVVFDVFTGTNLLPTATLLATAIGTAFDGQFDGNNPQNGHDVGLVFLPDGTNLKPVPYNHNANAVAAGDKVKIIGYGDNAHDDTGVGTKRSVSTNIDTVSTTLLTVGNANKVQCHGDSGGPVLKTINGVSTIVGIVSFGTDQVGGTTPNVCITAGTDTNVAFVSDFIDTNIHDVTGGGGGGGSGGGGTSACKAACAATLQSCIAGCNNDTGCIQQCSSDATACVNNCP